MLKMLENGHKYRRKKQAAVLWKRDARWVSGGG
jgi:hypothetical protein